MIRGYRKLVTALVAMGGAFLVPLNEHQASVVIAVACTMIGGNAAIGIGNKLAETLGNKINRRIGSDTSDPRNT